MIGAKHMSKHISRQIQIFLAGVMVIVPLAVTAWAVAWIAKALGQWGSSLLSLFGLNLPEISSVYWGIPVILVLLYVIGLMARSWIFRWLFQMIDKTASTLPGIKTIYQSVRDLMKLFASDSNNMGKVVLY
ncbi:MAG TPA: DUF502 domain-containing protein, partial [Phycisphaerae bacterium]|nr:DUF502 domain-containing protein [Phycisphaerae bacterium]